MATAATKAANQKNLEAAGRTSSSFYTGSSSAGSNAPAVPNNVVSTNPHDAPGYDPATDPTSSVFKANKGIAPTAAIPPTTTPQADAIQQDPATQPPAQPNTNLAQAIAGKGSALTSAEMNDPAALNDLASRYKTGLANVQAQGLQPATTQGQASTAIQSALPGPQSESPSVIGDIMETDSNFDSILTMYDEFMSPQTQKVSLVEEYQQMSKSLGIEGMNAELLNAKRIIEGTEDDIRSEITAVGGFGTESQVLALANARNKSLIKNYNYLLESRDSAMTQLNTMMNLSVQDRQMAEAEFDRKMGFAFKVAEFKERAVSNARSNFNTIVSKVGYKGLLDSLNGNLYDQRVAEQTLGIAPGGLNKLATIVDEEQELNLELKREQIATEKAQRSKIYSDMKPTTPTVSPYQEERAFRTVQSVDELGIKARNAPGIFGRTAALPLPGFLRSDAYRNFKTELDTLKANISFGELQAMREASKTGGALGNVANQELELLQATLGGLNMNQSAENFQKQLSKVKTSINRWNQAQSNTMTENTITAPTGEEIIITD